MTDTPDTEYSAALLLTATEPVPVPFDYALQIDVSIVAAALQRAEARYEEAQTIHTKDHLEHMQSAVKSKYLLSMLNEIEQLRFAVATRDGLIKEYERQLAGKRREVAGG